MGLADIFISYAREDAGWVRLLAAELELRGRSVFWDRRIPTGQTWRSHIGTALKKARCVVVVWSSHSIESDWVIEEADEGKRRRVLVPILKERVKPPIGFGQVQTADLSGWRRGQPSEELDMFLEDLARMLGPAPPRKAEQRPIHSSAAAVIGREQSWSIGPIGYYSTGPPANGEPSVPAAPAFSAPVVPIESKPGSATTPEPLRVTVTSLPFIQPASGLAPSLAAADSPSKSAIGERGDGPSRDVPSEPDPPFPLWKDHQAHTRSVPLPQAVDVSARPQADLVSAPQSQSKHNVGQHVFLALLAVGVIGAGLYASILSSPAPSPAPQVAIKPAPNPPPTGPKPAQLQSGQIFTDTLKDGSPCPFCPEMVVVPVGSFTMGSSEAERKWFLSQGGGEKWTEDEQPAHRVRISASFALGQTEVTRGQFARFVEVTRRDMRGGCRTWMDGEWRHDGGKDWQSPGFDQDDSHPVVCVNWNDALAYVEWLKEQTGEAYQLPSEALWEYAARGGTTTMRFWGDDLGNETACRYANVADRAFQKEFTLKSIFKCNDDFIYASPVKSFLANSFLLFDILGNVWEWAQDCYSDNYDGAPVSGSTWESGACDKRVTRGGSWVGHPRDLRSADRLGIRPAFRINNLGFRVAKVLNS